MTIPLSLLNFFNFSHGLVNIALLRAGLKTLNEEWNISEHSEIHVTSDVCLECHFVRMKKKLFKLSWLWIFANRMLNGGRGAGNEYFIL